MRRLFLTAVAGLFCVGIAAIAAPQETPLPLAQDLAQETASAHKQGMPLILLVSLNACSYCEEVRRLHLAPLEKTGVMVRQIYLDRDTELTGFDGLPTTQRQLSKKLAVKVAPTVLFLNPKGERLADPIIGALHEDFYGEYLSDAIAASKKKLSKAP